MDEKESLSGTRASTDTAGNSTSSESADEVETVATMATAADALSCVSPSPLPSVAAFQTAACPASPQRGALSASLAGRSAAADGSSFSLPKLISNRSEAHRARLQRGIGLATRSPERPVNHTTQVPVASSPSASARLPAAESLAHRPAVAGLEDSVRITASVPTPRRVVLETRPETQTPRGASNLECGNGSLCRSPTVYGLLASACDTSGVETRRLLETPDGARRPSQDSTDDREFSPCGGEGKQSFFGCGRKSQAALHLLEHGRDLEALAHRSCHSDDFDSDDDTLASRRDGRPSFRDVRSASAVQSRDQETPQRATWSLSKGIHATLLRRLAVIFTFVAVVSCWGVMDVWIAALTEEESVSELIYYGGLTGISVAMTIAVQICATPDNSLVFVLSAILSFLAAVGGWGFLNAVVFFAAGDSIVFQMFYFFCFFAVAVAFIVFYMCFVDPEYSIDVVGAVM
uniref:Putative transmembrane protein n=1 Tax=Toxoplasma gondii COUG TaxID=1074873 RepID=A0A2G8YBT1_TOXGO|nr:putative transmembrane protein [Toxoplasma gondii COUG]